MPSKINICMITDNNYVIPTAVAMTSAIENKNKSSHYHFYLLLNNVSDDNKNKLLELKRNNVSIDFIEVNNDKYSSIMVKTHVPTSALLKFDIPNLIYENKILYIDGDIIVQKDLSKLYNINIQKYSLASVRDMGGELKQKFNSKVGTNKYFNSGVLLLNLDYLRKNNISEKLILAKKNNPQWKCMDQDAFNYVLNSSTKWIDVKYNSMIALYKSYGYNIKEINDFYETKYKTYSNFENNSVIIHLAGESGQRPWKVSNGAFGSLWDKYYKLSPFKNNVLKRGLYKSKNISKIKSETYKFHKIICKYKLFNFIPLLSIEEK